MKYISKLLSLINNLRKKKIQIFKINKCDVLLFDENYARLNLQNFNFSVFDFNVLHLKYIFIAFLNFIFINKKKKTFRDLYKNVLFKAHDPKLVIAHFFSDDLDQLKEICPNVKIIIYQHIHVSNYFLKNKKFLEKIRKNFDLALNFIIFSKKDIPLYKKMGINIKNKILFFGSLRGNEKSVKNSKIKYDIMYTSQFFVSEIVPDTIRKNKQNKISYKEILKEHNKIEEYIIRTISEFCRNYQKKFIVALRYLKHDKIKKYNFLEEIKFIKKIEKNNDYNQNQINSWSLASQSKMIITRYSNMGLELRAQGRKVLFLPIKNKHLTYNLSGSIIPHKNEINTYNKKNKLEIFRRIKYLLKNENNRSLNMQKKIMEFDKGNKKFKKVLKDLLKTYND